MNDGINLSDEYRDLARYFRLSILRDRGVLPPDGLREIEEIVKRNERAAAIEETRNHYNDGEIDQDDYEREVAIHRQALANAIKNATQEPEEKKEEISEEFKDLARYFRLSILRNNGQLPPKGLEELDEIVANNERASAIEEGRNRLINGEISIEDYEELYAVHRAALADEIKRVYEANVETLEEHAEIAEEEAQEEAQEESKSSEETQKEEEIAVEETHEEEIDEPEEAIEEEEEKEVPSTPVVSEPKEEYDEFDDLARYFRLSILRNNGQLPPKGLEELSQIAERNERAAAIEETRRQLLNGNIKEDDYRKVVEVHRAALADAIKNRDTSKAKEDNGEHRLNIADDYRELARYFRLSMLRDGKMLPPIGLKELSEIAERNPRAHAVEEAHKKLESGEISKEDFYKVHDVHRAALAEEIKRVSAGIERKEEPVQHEPVQEAPQEKRVPENLDRYRIALKALKAYKEYSDRMKQLGMRSINELTEFLGLGKKAEVEEQKTK